MKRTQLKDTIRNIRGQRGSYYSVIVISLLATLAFLGVSYASTALETGISAYYSSRNSQDLQVWAPTLLSEGDLEEIRALDGVADAEGSNETPACLKHGGTTREISVISLTERVNLPELTEGRLPETAEECMVELGLAKEAELRVGDTVRLTQKNGEKALLLEGTDYLVTGIFQHPEHITYQLPITYYITVPGDAFRQDILDRHYIKAAVTLSDAPANCFSPAYRAQAKAAETALRQLTEEQERRQEGNPLQAYYEEQLRENEEKLQEADSQLLDAEKRIADAERQIADGKREIADGERQLADGKKEIADGERQLLDAAAEIEDGERQLADGKKEIEDGERRLSDAAAQIADAERQLADGKKEIEDGEGRLRDAEAEIAEGECRLSDAAAEIEDGERQLSDAAAQIADAERQFADAETQIADGEAQLADGEAQLAEAEARAGDDVEQKLADGRASLAEAERLLKLAPGQLAAGEALLISGKEQLDAGKSKLDAGWAVLSEAKQGLDMLESFLNKGIDWIRDHTDAETWAAYGVDREAVLKKIEAMTVDEIMAWLKEESGYNAGLREWSAGMSEYQKKLEEYEKGRNDYYYQGEQYLDGLTAYEQGKKKLEEAEAQLAELEAGREQLKEGRAELEAAKAQLEEKRAELEAGKAEYAEGLRELEAGKAEYAEGLAELEAGKAEYEAGLAELEAGKAEYAEKLQELEAGKAEYEAGLAELEAGKAEYAEKLQELEAGKAEYEAGLKELEAGKAEYAEKLQELEAGKAELEQAEAELEAGRLEYEENRALLQTMHELYEELKETVEKETLGTRVTLNRQANGGYMFAEENADMLNAVSKSFSMIFVVIGAAVILSSVSRMVDEQSVLVGAAKSLGMVNREILRKYQLFGISATCTGVLAGVVLAYFLIQRLILDLFFLNYEIPAPEETFLPLQTLLFVIGGFLLADFAVRISCAGLLRSPAVVLLRGRNPVSRRKKSRSARSGKSLFSRLVLLNMISDPGRFLVTVLSVAGCCVLLMVGFSLRYAEKGVIEAQFSHVQTCDAELRYDPELSISASSELAALLRERGIPTAEVHRREQVFRVGDRLTVSTLLCAEEEDIDDVYRIEDYRTRRKLQIPEHGILIPNRLHEVYGIDVGDRLTFYDSRMTPCEAEVSGIFNNYTDFLIFLSPEACREVFGTAPLKNCFLLSMGGSDLRELSDAASAVPGFLSLSDNSSQIEFFTNNTAALDKLVVCMICMAGMMAYFILMNLSESYMIRKTGELTVMRINGFTMRECIRYAAMEPLLTGVLGIVLGLLLGAGFSYGIIREVEMSFIQMIRSTDWRAVLFSALITAAFSLGINARALRHVKTLKLSDAM